MMKVLLCWLLLVPFVLAEDSDPAYAILGKWDTEGKKSVIEITRDGDEFNGKIFSLGKPTYPEDDPEGRAGKPRLDDKNPDPELRVREMVGIDLIQGFAYKKKKWAGGTIYDPESGKTYRCQLTLKDDDTLSVRGFIGVSLLGRTTVWTRHKEEK